MRTLGLLLTIVSLAAACKGNFQIVADAAPEPPDAPPDAPPALSCVAPRFSMAGSVNRLAAVTTPRGYDVFIVDDVGTLRGFSYEFDVKRGLVEKLRDVEIITNVTGTIAAIALDPSSSDSAEVMLAVPCSPGSTTLIPLDAQLKFVGTSLAQSPGVIYDGWVGGYGSLVRTDADRLVFLATKDQTTELYVKSVSRLGIDEDAGSPRRVDTAGNEPTDPRIMRAGTGYLVVWNAVVPSPDEVQAVVLDDKLNVATPTTKISPDQSVTMLNANLPSAAYSAQSGVSLFAWVIKPNRDHVWFSLRDERLKTSATVSDMPEGNAPAIIAGDHDFLVVWTDAVGGKQLSAARIGADGSYSRPGLETTGGKGVAWDVVVRHGQQALVWYEEGGSGPYLWFDPLCSN